MPTNRALVVYLLAVGVALNTFGANAAVVVGAPALGQTIIADSVSPSFAELPLPEVPATLTAPAPRAAYILAHFWDAIDFRADTLRSHNRAFMEQSLVNFFSLFPHAPADSLPSGIDRLLARAAADSAALALTLDIASEYLYAPDSPMRCEDYYIQFLEGYLRLPGLSEYSRLRPAYELEMARKNRPGTIATDFAYTDTNGERHRLHTTPTTAERLLLLFYDPECVRCAEVMGALRQSPALSRHIAAGRLTVLAVYTGRDRRLWSETKAPRQWIVAIDDSRIAERGLYDLAAMPALYLLDGHTKSVILKGATIAEIEKAIAGD